MKYEFVTERCTGDLGLLEPESGIASLCELAKFGAAPSQNAAVKRRARAATEPEREVIEFVKRETANVVLSNKD